MLTVYFSPAFGDGGHVEWILPARSAAWVPFFTVTPADSSNPGGTSRPTVSMLWAVVFPYTKVLPAASGDRCPGSRAALDGRALAVERPLALGSRARA